MTLAYNLVQMLRVSVNAPIVSPSLNADLIPVRRSSLQGDLKQAQACVVLTADKPFTAATSRVLIGEDAVLK